MSKYLKVKMEDGYELYIQAIETEEQVDHNYDGENVPAASIESVKEKVVEATELFGKALPTATGFAKRIVEQIEIDIPSDKIELEFSIALNAEAKAVVCSGGAEMGFKVKLEWSKPKD